MILGSGACHRAAADPPRVPTGFVKGYTWGWTGSRGEYLGDAPDRSLRLLAATGTEWIALTFAAHMRTKSSPEVLYGDRNRFMVSDKEIRRAIRLARRHRFKIMMKPAIICHDGAWRATIGFESEDGWDRWWKNYEAFLLHYAQIAADTKCETLCVGVEMHSTERFADHWRRVIADVRKVYPGPIVYNANHEDVTRVAWFDAVDVIGVSAYYRVATKDDTSLERMLARWKPIRARLRQLSARWKRPILFAEIGVRSARTCSAMPWDWSHTDLPYDGQEQARYYEAAFRSFSEEPWFLGFCWWDWKARLDEQEKGAGNTDFCVHGKPAEAVLRRWYLKIQRPVSADSSRSFQE